MSSFSILAVCIGNVCRSPVAERLLAQRLDEAGVLDSFDVRSAGVRAMVGHEVMDKAGADLRERGGDPAGFEARQFTEGMGRSELILAATIDVRRQVLEEVPGAMRRAFTWKEFAALVDGRSAESPRELVAEAAARRSDVFGVELDTDDPMGRSSQTFARVGDEIDAAISTIAHALVASAAPLEK